jgi:hypothetical protein
MTSTIDARNHIKLKLTPVNNLKIEIIMSSVSAIINYNKGINILINSLIKRILFL